MVENQFTEWMLVWWLWVVANIDNDDLLVIHVYWVASIFHGYSNRRRLAYLTGMPENHRKEALSRAYAHAIAAKAGATFTASSHDYGIDIAFNEVQSFEGEILEAGATFKCQLKATKNWRVSGGYITYHMKASDYNRLVTIHNQR